MTAADPGSALANPTACTSLWSREVARGPHRGVRAYGVPECYLRREHTHVLGGARFPVRVTESCPPSPAAARVTRAAPHRREAGPPRPPRAHKDGAAPSASICLRLRSWSRGPGFQPPRVEPAAPPPAPAPPLPARVQQTNNVENNAPAGSRARAHPEVHRPQDAPGRAPGYWGCPGDGREGHTQGCVSEQRSCPPTARRRDHTEAAASRRTGLPALL